MQLLLQEVVEDFHLFIVRNLYMRSRRGPAPSGVWQLMIVSISSFTIINDCFCNLPLTLSFYIELSYIDFGCVSKLCFVITVFFFS